MSAKTLMFIILGLIVPLWPVSLPLFWYLAYRSSKEDSQQKIEIARAGQGAVFAPVTQEKSNKPSLAELKDAKELLDSGIITQEEFDKIKADALAITSTEGSVSIKSEGTLPDGFVPLEEFARVKNIDEPKLVSMVRDGFYQGRKIGENWYISASEFTQS
ncbi:SHOCT domain-containing protein [Alteromonas aestuariivivens]|nr:SHOCT domain-containing protein [Alteromonas aestuariivivens]